MTTQDFINKYNNRVIDFDGVYGNQCMDLMHQYIFEVLGMPDGRILAAPAAKDVYLNFDNVYGHDSFEKIDNTPTGVPQNGDIVFWGTGVGQYGHVAIFIEGDANKFRSFDQNFPTDSNCHVQEHTYKGVLGWLRAKENQPMATITQKELDEIRISRDQNYNDFQTEKEKNLKLTEDLKKEQEHSGTLLDELQKESEKNLDTTNQLLDAQKALQPIYNEILGAKKVLGIKDTADLITAIKVLKASKIKTIPKPKTFAEKLKFLLS